MSHNLIGHEVLVRKLRDKIAVKIGHLDVGDGFYRQLDDNIIVINIILNIFTKTTENSFQNKVI